MTSKSLLLMFCSILLTARVGASNLLNLSHSELDRLAIHYGGDKASQGLNLDNYESPKEAERYPHDYAKKYDFYFSHIKDNPIKFLEIGFCHGASARMWIDYFPYAELYFMDNKASHFEKYGADLPARCHLHVADQSNTSELLDFIAQYGGDFDIIIDDGGHTMKQQITSFTTLFPYVKKGGVYIIEDLHTSYWRPYGGHGTLESPKAEAGSAIHFLQKLIHDLNFIGARTGCASKKYCPDSIYNQLTYYQKHIESIHFYDSLCFIFKE